MSESHVWFCHIGIWELLISSTFCWSDDKFQDPRRDDGICQVLVLVFLCRLRAICCGWNLSGKHNRDTSRHDDVIKCKHFPHYWPFVRGIHRSPVTSQHKGQWRGALMFSLICVWINGWVNNREAGDLRRYRAHYDVTVMTWKCLRITGPLWEKSTSKLLGSPHKDPVIRSFDIVFDILSNRHLHGMFNELQCSSYCRIGLEC